MKKLSFLFLCTVISTAGFAQGFYFRTGLGYAFAQAGQTMDATGMPYSGTYNVATNAYSMKGASFAAGVHGYAALGRMFTKHVGAEVNANIGLLPKKYTIKLKNVALGSGSSTYTGDVDIEQQATMPFIIEPSLVLQSGGDKWNIYSRFGAAIPLLTEITRNEIQMNAPSTGAATVTEFTSQISNSFSIGFTGAAGVLYKLNSRMSIWGEVSMLSMSVYAKQSQLTAVTRNGQSYPLSAVSGNQTVNYNRSGVIDSTGVTQPAYSQPFSNVGINLGINISMSRKSRGATTSSEGTKSKRPAPAKFR